MDLLCHVQADTSLIVVEGSAALSTHIGGTTSLGSIPSAFALFQNVPNPFNPLTTIAYDLPEAIAVILTVYTITGQKVGTLVSGHQEAGHYEVTWDDRGFASGIYLYRLEAGSFTDTRKALLVR